MLVLHFGWSGMTIEIKRYQRLQEQVRQIKAKNFEVSDEDQRQINMIEASMKKLFNDSQKLF